MKSPNDIPPPPFDADHVAEVLKAVESHFEEDPSQQRAGIYTQRPFQLADGTNVIISRESWNEITRQCNQAGWVASIDGGQEFVCRRPVE